MTYYYEGKPYVPDIEKWSKHFVDMVKGKIRPDLNGNYQVDPLRREEVKKHEDPQIQMVTPMAAAVERAKSELSQETKVHKRKTTTTRKAPKKKVVKIQPKDVWT
jgi:hypothetical protein